MQKVLAIFAHPDDETFICGGTLAQFATSGSNVSLVCATKGEMGRRVGQPPAYIRENIGSIRESELREACGVLGIERIHFLGLRDKTLEIHPLHKLKQSLLHIMDQETPNIVVTFHPKWGGHPDHCAIGLAATETFTEYRRVDIGQKLFYVCSGELIRNSERYGLLPDDLTKYDVSASLDRKLRAFRAHKTQSEMNQWLWNDDEIAMSKLWPDEYLLDADTLIDKTVGAVHV